MKKVALLGSTGSIGKQTLDVIRSSQGRFSVVSLVAYSNKELLTAQAKEFGAKAYLITEDGEQCLLEAVKGADVAVVATRGIISLEAVLLCIKLNIDVALANKEVLVCGGKLVCDALKNSKSRLLPVDSEHSAVWQCAGSDEIEKIFLTASGGPFWNTDAEELKNVSAVEALKHPNWNMGKKITVDSATLVNKAFEIVEAKWLFGLQPNQIEVVVHRQSIVHSLVMKKDGSVLGQFSNPDMKLPISYALSYPDRFACPTRYLTVDDFAKLTFEKPDYERFPCLQLGYDMIKTDDDFLPTVVNASNDVCVDAFLDGKMKFNEFYSTIKSVVNHFEGKFTSLPFSVQNVKAVDRQVREFTANQVLGEK